MHKAFISLCDIMELTYVGTDTLAMFQVFIAMFIKLYYNSSIEKVQKQAFSRALTCEAESKHRQQLDRGCMQQNSVHDTE